MRINKIQNNNQSFKSITVEKKNLRQIDMKKIIRPCLDSLREITDGYDITLKSCSVNQTGRNFISPRPAIEISIEPKIQSDKYISSAKLKMPIFDYETDSETLFDTIKSTIRNVFE